MNSGSAGGVAEEVGTVGASSRRSETAVAWVRCRGIEHRRGIGVPVDQDYGVYAVLHYLGVPLGGHVGEGVRAVLESCRGIGAPDSGGRAVLHGLVEESREEEEVELVHWAEVRVVHSQNLCSRDARAQGQLWPLYCDASCRDKHKNDQSLINVLWYTIHGRLYIRATGWCTGI